MISIATLHLDRVVTQSEELVEVLGDLVKVTVSLQRFFDPSNRLLATL